MPKKLISASLHIIAILLLCSIALTGCLGTASAFPGQSDMNGEYLTPDTPQDFISENTQSQTTTTAHEHTFSDATCTLPKTCSVCGASEGEPLEHNWNKATCITPATCSVCGEVDGIANGHSWKPATCSTPIICDACGQTDGKPIEHNWIAATCTSASTCKYCGQTKGTAIDHNWKAATCTEAATCIVCGKTKGSPTDHQWKSATCTTPKTCKVCQKTKGSTTSHNYSKGKCKDCGDIDTSYDSSSSSMVWIPTNGGKKYHSHSGCSNMKNPKKVSLSKAKSLGFTACKKCY